MPGRSGLFATEQYKEVQQRVKSFLNGQESFLSSSTAGSPRAVGDAIAAILSEAFASILGPICTECSTGFARRAMADIAFTDDDRRYYVVDVKTHRTDTKFNMPNLTSVDRLARFYEDDANYFVVLMVAYSVDGIRLSVSDVTFVPIEFLDWRCLTIGALGWGQVQIADSNRIIVNPQYSRKKWMLEFCDVMLDFYPREVSKIEKRLSRFAKLRDSWLSKPDNL